MDEQVDELLHGLCQWVTLPLCDPRNDRFLQMRSLHLAQETFDVDDMQIGWPLAETLTRMFILSPCAMPLQ